MTDDLADAWDALLAANTDGLAGRAPSREDGTHLWHLYAFDPAERPKVGRRSREWTATGETEAARV